MLVYILCCVLSRGCAVIINTESEYKNIFSCRECQGCILLILAPVIYLSIYLTSGILLMQEGYHVVLKDESSGCLLFLSRPV